MSIPEQKKIRILKIVTRLSSGGVSQQVLSLFKEFNNDKYKTFLVSGQVSPYETPFKHSNLGQNYYFIKDLQRNIHPLKDLKTFFKILYLIKKIKPHIVHTHLAKAGFLGRCAAIIMRVPIRIHSFHGHTFHSYFSRFTTRIFIYIEKILAKKSILITLCEQQKKDLNHYLNSPASLETIRLGLPLTQLLNSHAENKTSLREEIKAQDNEVLIGIIGRLAKIKNHLFFLEVAKKILSAQLPTKFLIIGDGEERKKILAKITSENLQEKVFFLGWRQDLNNIYNSLDIVALTSCNEGTPVSLIEALAFGKPVISTAVGGVFDIIENQKNGFIIDGFDLEEYTKKLTLLIKNKNLRKEMGYSTRTKILKQYDQDSFIKNMDFLYTKLTH